MDLARALDALLLLPRSEQPEALSRLRASLPRPVAREEWNTTFGAGSLFAAWTSTTVCRGVHQANRQLLRPLLDARGPGWVAVEAGGGDGSLWRSLLRPDDRGTLVVVDPVEEVGAVVAHTLPPGVELVHLAMPVQDLVHHGLPDCDALVCSLTLHHLPGRDEAQRVRHGLEGPGKLEVLRLFAKALEQRDGLGLLNEADVHCDLSLAPGSEALLENILDSYVRRCARSICWDLAHHPEVDEDLQARWHAVLQHWCLDQVDLAGVPIEERDIYELDVGRWLELLAEAGLQVHNHRFTDPWLLFHQYRLGSVPERG